MKLGKNMIWIAPLVIVVAGGIGLYASHSHQSAATSSIGQQASGTGSQAGAKENGTTASGTSVTGKAATPSPEAVVATNPNAKKVDLTAYNAKEKALTDEAETIYNQITAQYTKLQNGSLSTADFKKAMMPLRDQMKNNWDEYNKFTAANGLTEKDRTSDTFKQGVELASNIRLQEYTFLINVTYYNLTKQKIAEQYKANLAQFEQNLQKYKDMTKSLTN